MADKLNFYTVDLGYVDLLKVAKLKKEVSVVLQIWIMENNADKNFYVVLFCK